MKHRLWAVAWGVWTCLAGQAQEETASVLDRGPHHAVLERNQSFPAEPGESSPSVTNTFVRIEDGLHYWDPEKQDWQEAQEEIFIVPTGAVAPFLQQKALFSSNGNDPRGALTLEIQGGVQLRSSVLGLRYFDAASGNEAVVAVSKDAIGELLPPNQIIYRDVLDQVRADIVYTVRRGSIEADLVLRELPPDPSDFGLKPETVLVEVVTEFFDPPEPTKHETILAS